jgi:Na+-translocating ferredoxin:NAD+ oxidoreductase RnfC subunit
MPHTASLGDVEVPVTYSPQEAVGLMREHGIVGAGGAGFPTYAKYQDPPNALIVNLAESEPGYYADKLLARNEPEALIDVFDWVKRTFSLEIAIIGAEDVAKPYLAELEELANELENFSIGYFDAKYKYGQERALCKTLLGVEIPASDIPPDHGIVVNNNETLWNIYNAAFRAEPVTSKFTHLYGEIEPLTVYDAPIGTLAKDLIEIHGSDFDAVADCELYDGGPILSDKVADPLESNPWAPVTRTTNAFLVVDKEKNQPKNQYYPDPDYEHNAIDAPWASEEIVHLDEEIDRVRVPVEPSFGAAPDVCVDEGDTVAKGEVIAKCVPELSVHAHASIPGEVTQVTDEFVQIER